MNGNKDEVSAYTKSYSLLSTNYENLMKFFDTSTSFLLPYPIIVPTEQWKQVGENRLPIVTYYEASNYRQHSIVYAYTTQNKNEKNKYIGVTFGFPLIRYKFSAEVCL